MKVITLLNEKGGVGKTTLAIHVAAGLAITGSRVVLIDADAQANATSLLGIRPRAALYNLMVRAGEPEGSWQQNLEAVHPDVHGGPKNTALFVVPSNTETRLIPQAISDGFIVKKRVKEIEQMVDYVVIDTSPTPNLFHATILAGSDYVLIPTECAKASAVFGLAATVLHTNQTNEKVQQYGVSGVEVIGVIPTKYRGNTVAHSEMLDWLYNKYGDLVWDPINHSVVFDEASMVGQTLYAYAPDHHRTEDMLNIVKRIQAEITL